MNHFKGKQFQKDVIIISVGYYLRYNLSYRDVHTQSNYNIGLVMHLLNHSSEAMTLTYLGLDQASRETMLDQIDFG
nr:hypothetical protein [Lactococcus garvieae]